METSETNPKVRVKLLFVGYEITVTMSSKQLKTLKYAVANDVKELMDYIYTDEKTRITFLPSQVVAIVYEKLT